MTALSRPSVASLLLEPRVSGLPLGTATGFLVERAGVVFLVTNRHVVRKRHPSGAFPDEIKIVHNEAGKLGAWTERAEPLFGQDGSPLWLEHPGYRDMMDVVALPLTQTNGIQVYGYDPWNPGPPIAVAPSESVSTVGFPFGWTAGGALAIWVQGTIASEPDLDFNNLPCFLIDSRTREGQSGSPVIVYRMGTYQDVDGNTVLEGGRIERFLGCYSGRMSRDSDLGFVWKANAIGELIDGGKPGKA